MQANGIAPRPSIPPACPRNEHIDYIEIPDSPVPLVEAQAEDEPEDSQSADMEAREKALLVRTIVFNIYSFNNSSFASG